MTVLQNYQCYRVYVVLHVCDKDITHIRIIILYKGTIQKALVHFKRQER